MKSDRVKARYERIAPHYDFWDAVPERLFYSAWRRRLWEGLAAGRILEIGVGTGKNIPFYPAGAQVTAIDTSPRMLKRAAKRAAARRDVAIELRVMDASRLSLADNTFDAVVGSFILTVLDEPQRALEEIKRVCRPGGALHLIEFTRSDKRLTALLQDLAAPLTYAVYGARVNRDITGLIERSGYRIVSAEALGGMVRLLRMRLPQ